MSEQKENNTNIENNADTEQNQNTELNLQEENNKTPGIKDKIAASFSSRKFRGGAYATAVSAVVIVIVIILNVIISQLDLKIDVTNDNKYTLTSVTKDYVKKIKDDITIYYLVQTGQENKTTQQIVEKYPGISSHIKVEYKDPLLYPNFASKYVDDKVTNDSVLVVNNTNKRVKYVDSSSMVVSQIDYQTYQSYQTGIDVEGQVTSAIQYVTTDNLPIMYTVTGHGEADLSSTITTALGKINVTQKSLNTLTTESIPEDCSVLLINVPQKDYSPDEVTLIKNYLSNGGHAIIYTDYQATSLDNFSSLLNYYGVSVVPGFVVEGSRDHYMGQYINWIVPNIESHDITSSLKSANIYIVAPYSSGLQEADSVRSTIETTPLLITSDEAYSKTDVNSSNAGKEKGDIEGPFNIGLAITEKYNEKETKLIVYGSSALIDESMVATSSLGNLDLFLNTVNYVTDKKDTLAVRTVSTEQQYLNVTAAKANLWSILIVVVLPVLVLVSGGYVVLRRRKK
ncbi:GldG family protein [Anaerocolumna xylanovorans]|uniref:ABC-type uncharacterized transport system n=1 Tax=Anaerocolumna xylanovorans DSM 12503 TaxID=1121345 RepID=A0A1M7YD27_9FIRM|nr:GldG family protein [Anaerocolumna xylanovorans]SHO50537.1 ABC-type uncharacterized transport system [Anaerocolumna xylanovorans DSM 12503]